MPAIQAVPSKSPANVLSIGASVKAKNAPATSNRNEPVDGNAFKDALKSAGKKSADETRQDAAAASSHKANKKERAAVKARSAARSRQHAQEQDAEPAVSEAPEAAKDQADLTLQLDTSVEEAELEADAVAAQLTDEETAAAQLEGAEIFAAAEVTQIQIKPTVSIEEDTLSFSDSCGTEGMLTVDSSVVTDDEGSSTVAAAEMTSQAVEADVVEDERDGTSTANVAETDQAEVIQALEEVSPVEDTDTALQPEAVAAAAKVETSERPSTPKEKPRLQEPSAASSASAPRGTSPADSTGPQRKPTRGVLGSELQAVAAVQASVTEVDAASSTPDDTIDIVRPSSAETPVMLRDGTPGLGNHASPNAVNNGLKIGTSEQVEQRAEMRFAAENHGEIVRAIRGEMLNKGGSMQLRLDPPELGALSITVRMQDGVMSASFVTTNDQATRLLGHSLGELKQILESAGVGVDKLHVSQSPRDGMMDSDGRQSSQQHQQNAGDASSQRDQQRKEILQKMWDKIAAGRDMDLTW